MENSIFTRTKQSSIEQENRTNTFPPWKIVIIDDEEQVHKVTELALKHFTFDSRSLQFIKASSANQAKHIFKNEENIAIALVDVVMETDHAGLDLIDYIRNELNNHTTRLILRTGQPGQAPEEKVIKQYDINDYKEKTELTVQKLVTLFYSTLRSYRDIITIEKQKNGLRNVVESSVQVLRSSTLNIFATSVLKQVLQLLNLSKSAIYCTTLSISKGERTTNAIVATGNYSNCISETTNIHFPEIVAQRFDQTLAIKHSLQFEDAYIVYTQNDSDYENLLYIELDREISNFERELLELYCTNVAIIYENLLLNEDIRETQAEIVYLLADAVEKRSKETGTHVKRVSLIAEKLAQYLGLSDYEIEQVKSASPLHDLGKIAIPDNILHKPGGFNNEERAVMDTHAEIGSNILSKSRKKLLNAAAQIALTHHEHWDGKGYPNGLSADDIPIFGRITALADVFDALGSKRCYKESWTNDHIKQFLLDASGKQFDPKLVNIVIDNYDEFCEIRRQFPD